MIQVNNDSIRILIHIKSTSNERFEYKASQYFIKIDTSQFSPLSATVTGNFSYSNSTVLPSGIIGMFAQVPNNETIIIPDSGNGTQIAKIIIRGKHRGPGSSQQLATWRNGPINPFTKIFAIVDSVPVDITTPQTHFFENIAVGIGGEEITSLNTYTLSQNYPNPFNPNTIISFTLPQREAVKLKVFDINGRTIVTLLNEIRNAGEHTITFNASDVASGAYFFQIKAGDFIATKKMLLIK